MWPNALVWFFFFPYNTLTCIFLHPQETPYYNRPENLSNWIITFWQLPIILRCYYPVAKVFFTVSRCFTQSISVLIFCKKNKKVAYKNSSPVLQLHQWDICFSLHFSASIQDGESQEWNHWRNILAWLQKCLIAFFYFAIGLRLVCGQERISCSYFGTVKVFRNVNKND